MAISKVILNGTAIMDVTQDTVVANKLKVGETAHAADGNQIIGTLSDPIYQNKSVSPDETEQTVTADSGYSGLGTVTVGAITPTYVGSGITRRASADLITSFTTGSNLITSNPTMINAYVAQASGKIVSSANDRLIILEIDPNTEYIYTWNRTALNNNSDDSNIAIFSEYPAINGTGRLAKSQHLKESGSISFISSDTERYVAIKIAQIQKTDLEATIANSTLYKRTSSFIAPAGYYSADAEKTFSSVVHAEPTVTINSSTGLITATHDQSSGGYIYPGTTTQTLQLTTQAAKTITPTTSEQTAVAAQRYTTGIIKVAAIPSDYIIPSGSQTVTSNDTYDVTSLAELVVDVPTGATINNQDKTVTPSESQQSISADSGYTGLGTVTVNAISSDYVGSGITTRSSADLTASGATVSVPAGYYSAAASKAVANGSAKTPATTITANPDISINNSGLITATASASKNITPTVSAGYVSSGTAGTVTVSGSDTLQLTTLGATTYNVSSSNQTITSGKYLTGTQTIRAVTTSNISAANIKAGVVVKVGDSADDDRITAVTGTFTSDATASAADINSGITAYVNGNKITGTQVIQRFYTGSSAPTSSLGSNGDIYLQE